MIGLIFPVRLLHSLLSAGFKRRTKRPINHILASLVSLVAGVFRSPNFFPSQVMVRSEQWWRRLPADLSSQGGRCGSVVRWRVFTCRRSIGGRSGLRIERFHRGLIGQRQKSMQWSQLGFVDYGRWPNVFFCCSLSRGDAPGYVEVGLWPKKGAVCRWAPKNRHRWARQNQPLEAKA
jgi:hypothetical protein